MIHRATVEAVFMPKSRSLEGCSILIADISVIAQGH